MKSLNSKAQLRTYFKNLRNDIDLSLKKEFDQKISENLWQFISSQNQIKNVGGFLSIKSEPDLTNLYSKINKESSIDLFFPKVIEFQLEFIKFKNWESFQIGPFGIKEPIGNTSKTDFNSIETLILVPALGIFKNGYRLGYGGGFYDRFLNLNPKALSIGIIYDEFYFPNLNLKETGLHDIPVSYLVTQKGVGSFL